jgi:hypothetical protein
MRIHVSTELNPSFAAELKDCGVYFSSIHPMKVSVHIIQFCFTNCVMEFMKSRLRYMDAVLLCIVMVTQTTDNPSSVTRA